MAIDNKDKKILNVPHLRFPEFSGEWEMERLDKIATLSKGIGISKEQLSNGGEPCILYGEPNRKHNRKQTTYVRRPSNKACPNYEYGDDNFENRRRCIKEKNTR